MEILTASIQELAAAVKSKKLSAVELTQFYLKRIANYDSKINAFISVNQEAVKEAQAVDAKIAKGEDPGSLAGIPIGIKDLLCTKGLKTTAASKILENFVPPYDATVVERLRKSGAVMLGKLNLDEFAMGSSNETSHFGPCKNPWDLKRVPGGSSGGSAAAVAAGLAVAAIGTDTGGSIRQPANFCNVVGVKPTYGRVSRYGIVAYASSLDQAGPMTRSVSDAAVILEAICGKDKRDMTTSEKSVPKFSAEASAKDLKGVRIGKLKEFINDSVDPEIRKSTEDALARAKSLGATIVDVSVPLTSQAVPIYYLIASSEASSNLARYDGVRYGYRADDKNLGTQDLAEFYSRTRGEGFGQEVQRRIMLGTYCLSSGYFDAYYNKACQVRRLLRDQFVDVFKSCDVVMSPVSTHAAFKIGERISDPLAMYLNDIFTVSTNLAGLPGMSLPWSFSLADKLPIGVQLTAAHFSESKMLQVASALESVSTAKGKVPGDYA